MLVVVPCPLITVVGLLAPPAWGFHAICPTSAGATDVALEDAAHLLLV